LTKEPVRIREIHSAILMRAYVLGGTRVPLARLAEELAGRKSADDISAAATDLVSAGLAIVERRDESDLMTLKAEGRRIARMTLDMFELMGADLNKPATSADRFLRQYDQTQRKKPSRWEMLKLEWRWFCRRNWG